MTWGVVNVCSCISTALQTHSSGLSQFTIYKALNANLIEEWVHVHSKGFPPDQKVLLRKALSACQPNTTVCVWHYIQWPLCAHYTHVDHVNLHSTLHTTHTGTYEVTLPPPLWPSTLCLTFGQRHLKYLTIHPLTLMCHFVTLSRSPDSLSMTFMVSYYHSQSIFCGMLTVLITSG